MCLYSKNRFPRIAWKPIKVYKVVYFKDSIYYTPYYDYKLKHKNLVNIVNTLLSIIVNTLLSIIFNIKKPRHLGFYIVNSGFFHSFYDKTAAQHELKNRTRLDWTNNYTLIECTIPKFSLYYKGEFGDICSNRLNTEFKKV